MHWMMSKPFQSGWSWASFLKYVLYDCIVYFLVTVFIRRSDMLVSVCLFLHPVSFSRKDNVYIILIGTYARPLGSWEQSRGEGAEFNRQTFSINPLFPILGSFTTPPQVYTLLPWQMPGAPESGASMIIPLRELTLHLLQIREGVTIWLQELWQESRCSLHMLHSVVLSRTNLIPSFRGTKYIKSGTSPSFYDINWLIMFWRSSCVHRGRLSLPRSVSFYLSRSYLVGIPWVFRRDWK